jgi:hypothetical protein
VAADVSVDEVAKVMVTTAISHFVEAVRALSDDPRRANVVRYLAASRALDDLRERAHQPDERNPQ